ARLACVAQYRRDADLVLDRDGNDIDAARNPGVDDFVLLGGVRLGRAVPEQVDAQLLGGLVRPFAAGDEIGVALALGHHGNGHLVGAAAATQEARQQWNED